MGDIFQILMSSHIDLCIKRETKLASEFLLVKSSENNFISLPAYYLIIWLMKAKKNFAKLAILKTGGLVSFWGVKIHFDKTPLKWCIFRQDKKKDFIQYIVVAFDSIKLFTH